MTAAILAWMATRIDMRAAAAAVASVSRPHLALVLALVAVDRVIMIWRWVLLLRAADIPIATADAARLFLTSSFVGSFLPAGVGGDAARAWGLSQVSARMGDALASVVVDRMLGILSLAAMGAAGLAAWTPGGSTPARSSRRWPCSAWPAWRRSGAMRLRWALPAHRHGGPVVRRLLRLADAVARYRGHRGALASVMAWSLAVQVLRIVQA